jgi:hypothetical protein
MKVGTHNWTRYGIEYIGRRRFQDHVSCSKLAREVTALIGEKVTTSSIKGVISRKFPDRRGIIRDEATANRRSRNDQIRQAMAIKGAEYWQVARKFVLSESRVRAIAPVGRHAPRRSPRASIRIVVDE